LNSDQSLWFVARSAGNTSRCQQQSAQSADGRESGHALPQFKMVQRLKKLVDPLL
jgi:hypothetical protein